MAFTGKCSHANGSEYQLTRNGRGNKHEVDEMKNSAARPRYRLFVEGPLGAGQDVVLSDDQLHYLRNVLRLRAGDGLALFNGRDGEFSARIEVLERRRAVMRPLSRLRQQQEGADIWLCAALIRRSRFEWLAEKATELGVRRLLPLRSERSTGDRLRTDRLQAIMREAAEQCERLDVPEIAPVQTLTALLASWDENRPLYYCAERDRDAGHGFLPSRSAAVLIGPEGGFSRAEDDMLRQQKFVKPVSLGPRILRAETAAVAALSLWQARAGDWRGKPGA